VPGGPANPAPEELHDLRRGPVRPRLDLELELPQPLDRGPQLLPSYAIRLADDFHRFYHEHRVLESEQRDFRLALCRATQHVIARSLDLIGVDAPDRM